MTIDLFPFEDPLLLYNFALDVSNPLVVPDVTGNDATGTLSEAAVWNTLGLQLNGSQTITVPDRGLIPAGTDFTIFMVVRNELALTSTPVVLMEWGSVVQITMDSTNGLSVKIDGDGCSGAYFPTLNRPFALAARVKSQAGQMEVQVAETNVALSVAMNDQAQPYVYKATGGSVGQNFVGTLIFMATFDRFCSNGQIGEMFEFMNDFLVNRGSPPDGAPFTDLLSFHAGTFQ